MLAWRGRGGGGGWCDGLGMCLPWQPFVAAAVRCCAVLLRVQVLCSPFPGSDAHACSPAVVSRRGGWSCVSGAAAIQLNPHTSSAHPPSAVSGFPHLTGGARHHLCHHPRAMDSQRRGRTCFVQSTRSLQRCVAAAGVGQRFWPCWEPHHHSCAHAVQSLL